MDPLPAPTLTDDRIVRVVAGLRPCRRGGLRLEIEMLAASGRRKPVVHNYGHGGCGVTIAPGCAQIAADLAEAALGVAPHGPRGEPGAAARAGASVAVLGAGVVGLMTALELLQRGHRVTIYAEAVGGATTSVMAGALWLPTGIDFGPAPPDIERLGDIVRRSRAALAALDRRQWGVQRLPVYEPAWAPADDRFVTIGAIDRPRKLDRLPLPGPARAGRVYETELIHTPRFLRELEAEIAALGGTFVARRFQSAAEIAALPEPVAVNCLALGSRDLFGDDAVYPARGVLVHMRPERLGYCVHDGYWYIFPREDVLVLGGSFEPDQWDPAPDARIAEAILARHRAFFGA